MACVVCGDDSAPENGICQSCKEDGYEWQDNDVEADENVDIDDRLGDECISDLDDDEESLW